jgi:transcriptional regulator with XRE-family HTH domain
MANLVGWWEKWNREAEKDPVYLAESLALEVAIEVYRQMKEAGLSQARFAERLGVSRPYVSQVLQGKTNMTILTLAKIAKALGSDLTIAFKLCSEATQQKILPFHTPGTDLDANATESRLPEAAQRTGTSTYAAGGGAS